MKKISALLLAGAISLSMLSGCGGGSGSTTSPAPSPAAPGTEATESTTPPVLYN